MRPPALRYAATQGTGGVTIGSQWSQQERTTLGRAAITLPLGLTTPTRSSRRFSSMRTQAQAVHSRPVLEKESSMPRAGRPSSARTGDPCANGVACAARFPAAPVGGWGAAVDHRAGREGQDSRSQLGAQPAARHSSLRADRGQLLATSRLWREATRRLRERPWRRGPPRREGGAPSGKAADGDPEEAITR